MFAWTLALLVAATLPRPLAQLESATKALGDAAQHGQWRRAGALLTASRRDVQKLRATPADPATLDALHADLAQVTASLARHDRWGAARAANLASSEVVALYRPHHPAVPVEVMQLDVLLRQAQLDGLTRVPARATAAVDQAIALWKELRKAPSLYDTPTAKRFDALLAAVNQALRAADAQALAKAAGQALDGVDALKRAFPVAQTRRRMTAHAPGR